MKSQKTAVIVINCSNGDKVIINPNSLRELLVTGRQVTFITPVAELVFTLTDYTLNDRLKPALRSRYNIIDVETNRAIRFQHNNKPHSLVALHGGLFGPGTGSTRFIFPKAFSGALLDGDNLTVLGWKATYPFKVIRAEGDADLFETVKVLATA